MVDARMKALLGEMFAAAIAAADPVPAIRANLPPRPAGRTLMIGAGKGAAQLAAAFERLWDGPISGLVVTRHGFAVPCRRIAVVEAGHPLPDAAGLAAAAQILDLVQQLGRDDLLVAMICGGGSALLPAPAHGLTLADEIAVNQALLCSGAPIAAMNAVRKQISRIKGGRLAAMSRAPVHSFIVSDIPGDDLPLVASGPTLADPATREDALRIIAQYAIDLPPAVAHHLRHAPQDAPRPGDRRLAGHRHTLVASAQTSLQAAAQVARRHGYAAQILSDAVEGEAAEVGREHGALARAVATQAGSLAGPCAILSGGETTVTIRGPGTGGPNGEYLLGLAQAIAGLKHATALAADTDGIDGSGRNAGAFVDGTTLARLGQRGLDPQALLTANDSWRGFDALGDLFVTGPTGTNVNDFRAILVGAST